MLDYNVKVLVPWLVSGIAQWEVNKLLTCILPRWRCISMLVDVLISGFKVLEWYHKVCLISACAYFVSGKKLCAYYMYALITCMRLLRIIVQN